MIREINRNEALLKQKAAQAGIMDIGVAQDLCDTLRANQHRCVGMAANMIGISKAIIVFSENGGIREMLNPQILKTEDAYETEEGCLSLDGTRKTTRYRKIVVTWQTRKFEQKRQTFTGFTAQIIQHEMDHLNGIII